MKTITACLVYLVAFTVSSLAYAGLKTESASYFFDGHECLDKNGGAKRVKVEYRNHEEEPKKLSLDGIIIDGRLMGRLSSVANKKKSMITTYHNVSRKGYASYDGYIGHYVSITYSLPTNKSTGSFAIEGVLGYELDTSGRMMIYAIPEEKRKKDATRPDGVVEFNPSRVSIVPNSSFISSFQCIDLGKKYVPKQHSESLTSLARVPHTTFEVFEQGAGQLFGVADNVNLQGSMYYELTLPEEMSSEPVKASLTLKVHAVNNETYSLNVNKLIFKCLPRSCLAKKDRNLNEGDEIDGLQTDGVTYGDCIDGAIVPLVLDETFDSNSCTYVKQKVGGYLQPGQVCTYIAASASVSISRVHTYRLDNFKLSDEMPLSLEYEFKSQNDKDLPYGIVHIVDDSSDNVDFIYGEIKNNFRKNDDVKILSKAPGKIRIISGEKYKTRNSESVTLKLFNAYSSQERVKITSKTKFTKGSVSAVESEGNEANLWEMTLDVEPGKESCFVFETS